MERRSARRAFVAKFPALHGARRADVAPLAPERAFAGRPRRHGHHVQPIDVLRRVDADEENRRRFERSSCGGFRSVRAGMGARQFSAHGRMRSSPANLMPRRWSEHSVLARPRRHHGSERQRRVADRGFADPAVEGDGFDSRSRGQGSRTERGIGRSERHSSSALISWRPSSVRRLHLARYLVETLDTHPDIQHRSAYI